MRKLTDILQKIFDYQGEEKQKFIIDQLLNEDNSFYSTFKQLIKDCKFIDKKSFYSTFQKLIKVFNFKAGIYGNEDAVHSILNCIVM